MQGRNTHGYGALSPSVYILAASAPYAPATPTSVLNNATVVISWVAPNNGGQNILGYTIYIQKADGVNYVEDFTYCDGS